MLTFLVIAAAVVLTWGITAAAALSLVLALVIGGRRSWAHEARVMAEDSEMSAN